MKFTKILVILGLVIGTTQADNLRASEVAPQMSENWKWDWKMSAAWKKFMAKWAATHAGFSMGGQGLHQNAEQSVVPLK